MEFAIWTDKLSVDIELIDDQHKILIRLINDTSQILLNKKRGNIGEILIELHEYTKKHFSEEERLFTGSAYPQVEKHLKEHRYFIEKISDFEKTLEVNDTSVSLDLLEFLKNWLFYHIEIVDKGYALYVKEAVRGY